MSLEPEAQDQLPDENIEEQIEERHEEEPPQPEPVRKNGYITRDEWIAKGRDPDDWISEKQFEKNGNLISQIERLRVQQEQSQKEFDARLENVNKLNQAMIKEKQRELDEAIGMADVTKARAIQGEIDDLNAPVKQPEVQQVDQVAANWEANNPWINDINDPRTPYAQTRYNLYLSQNMSPQEAINQMEADVNKAFSKPQRQATTTERNVSRPGKKAEQKITMADVPKADIQNFRSMFKSDEEFLTAYKDITKGN